MSTLWGYTLETSVAPTLPGPTRLVIENDRITVLRGVDAIADKIRAVLHMFLGEWFLDESIGIPWFTEVLIKNPDLRHIEALITKHVRAIPGVRDVFEMRLSFDSAARHLDASFRVRVADGTLLQFSDQNVEVLNG